MCHEPLSKGKVVHAAIQMGCPTCHTAIDASKMPHKKTNKIAKGLSSKQPGLCFTCHDKTKFGKKTVHAAIGMGCTGCHNPHSSKNAKLLISEQPQICYGCHDKKSFSGKKASHAPVAGGMCSSCHAPHSSDSGKLLLSPQPDLCFTCHDKTKFASKVIHAPVTGGMCTSCHAPHQSDSGKLLSSEPPDLCYNCHDKAEFSKKNVHMAVLGGCGSCHKPHASENNTLLSQPTINALCLTCHADVAKRPHAAAGFGARSHPLKAPKDPARPGREFSCSSCHNPHSSDNPKLFRFNAKSGMGLCLSCHKK